MIVNVDVKIIQIEMINLIANYFESQSHKYYCVYINFSLSKNKDKKLEVLDEL